jgi:hypothetical protein
LPWCTGRYAARSSGPVVSEDAVSAPRPSVTNSTRRRSMSTNSET